MLLEVVIELRRTMSYNTSNGVSESPFVASFDDRISLAHEYWLWPDSAMGYEEQ
jgi:hypothetical protein